MDKQLDSQVKRGTRNRCYHAGMIPIYFMLFSNQSQGKVEELWDTRNEDQIFRSWKYWSWWKSQAPGEEIEYFISELHSRIIAKTEGLDKLRWGYTNSGNFNPKESLGLLIGGKFEQEDGGQRYQFSTGS